MDKFFSQKYCDRCGGDLSGGRIMSKFNTDCICMDCKRKETKMAEYKSACEAENAAVKRGETNFQGIGLPSKK